MTDAWIDLARSKDAHSMMDQGLWKFALVIGKHRLISDAQYKTANGAEKAGQRMLNNFKEGIRNDR